MSENAVLAARDNLADAGDGASIGPRRAPGVSLADLPADLAGIIGALGAGSDPDAAADGGTVAVRVSNDEPEVLLLQPLVAEVLRLCDGHRSTRDIAASLDRAIIATLGLPAAEVCEIAIEHLVSSRLVEPGHAAPSEQ